MSTYRSSIKCKASYILLLFFALISIIIVLFSFQLSNHINEISEFEGKKTANEIINMAVKKQLECVPDDPYISIERNKKGQILSVNVESDIVNEIQNSICTAINNDLKKLDNEEIKVPIGTLSGITFLTGRGSDLSIKLHQIGAVNSELKSKFESAGINQTKFKLFLKVSVEISAVLPAGSTDIKLENEYLISETIIIGEVPKIFLSE